MQERESRGKIFLRSPPQTLNFLKNQTRQKQTKNGTLLVKGQVLPKELENQKVEI